MPNNTVKHFGRGEAAWQKAVDWAQSNADDEDNGELHLMEVTLDPGDEFGSYWVVSGDQLDAFYDKHGEDSDSVEDLDTFGIDRGN